MNGEAKVVSACLGQEERRRGEESRGNVEVCFPSL